jgi:hypothetical protein
MNVGAAVVSSWPGRPNGAKRMMVLRSAWAVNGRTAWRLAVVLAGALLAACSGMSPGDTFSGTPAAPTQPGEGGASIGAGQVKVGLVLPLSASGNAGAAGTAMRSAAEMALAEFNVTDLQLLVKDDGGNAPGARQVAQQAIDEGAEIILGPIFAHSVSPVGQLARSRNIPVMAFSTDANVATRGVYLLSFLPESDVDRIVSYAISQGKKSFAAAIPDNALWLGSGSRIQAIGGAARWSHRRARALCGRPQPDATTIAPSRRRRLVPMRFSSRMDRFGAGGGPGVGRLRRRPQARADSRLGAVGRSADFHQRSARGRLVRGP